MVPYVIHGHPPSTCPVRFLCFTRPATCHFTPCRISSLCIIVDLPHTVPCGAAAGKGRGLGRVAKAGEYSGSHRMPPGKAVTTGAGCCPPHEHERPRRRVEKQRSSLRAEKERRPVSLEAPKTLKNLLGYECIARQTVDVAPDRTKGGADGQATLAGLQNLAPLRVCGRTGDKLRPPCFGPALVPLLRAITTRTAAPPAPPSGHSLPEYSRSPDC